MIRHALLAATALLTLASLPARAQGIPVYDSANFLSQVKNLAEWFKQLQAMEQQYRMLVSQYEAIAHLPQQIEGIGRELTSDPLRNALPAVEQMQGLVTGTASGVSGGMTGAYKTANSVFEPQGGDFVAQELRRRAQGNANFEGLATAALQVIEQRSAALGEFLGAIGESPDIQQTAAIQARLQLEQNFVAGQQVQATQLATLATIQAQVNEQRAAEKRRQDYEENAARLGGDTGAVMAGGQ